MKKNKTNQLNQNKQFNKTILRLRNKSKYCSAEGLWHLYMIPMTLLTFDPRYPAP